MAPPDGGVRKPGPNTVAKSNRLLHAICAISVAVEEIRRNPCVLPGAGQEPHSERPALTAGEVEAIAEAVPPRWRGLVVLAAYGGLRFGELAELPRGVRHEGRPRVAQANVPSPSRRASSTTYGAPGRVRGA